MATFISKLSARAWITVDELAEWLSVKDEKVDVPQAEVKSFLVFQDIRYTSKLIGVLGDAITIEYKGGGTKGSETVSVVGDVIEVTIESGVSTVLDILTAVQASGPASALVFAAAEVISPDTLPIVEGRTQVVAGPTNLAGGIDDVPFASDSKLPETRRRYEMLINAATQRIESILNTTVIAKEYQDEFDGNGSNTMVPSKWPMLSVTELKIDFNRVFPPESVVAAVNFILRGAADIRQDVAGNDIRIVGNDVVLINSDTDNIIGTIFAGSVLGSIRMKYLAGWGRDADDVPFDLKLAAFQLVEFWDYKRSNRDIGLVSKGVMGQSYSKFQDGIPETIMQILDQYINHSFGQFEKVQNNVFGV